MRYFKAQINLFFHNFYYKLLDFFDAVSFHTGRALNLITNNEKTKAAKYHVRRASKKFISNHVENAWNWSSRLASSESFRIFDEDV